MKKEELKEGMRVISKYKYGSWHNVVGTISSIDDYGYVLIFDKSGPKVMGSNSHYIYFQSDVDRMLEKHPPDDCS